MGFPPSQQLFWTPEAGPPPKFKAKSTPRRPPVIHSPSSSLHRMAVPFLSPEAAAVPLGSPWREEGDRYAIERGGWTGLNFWGPAVSHTAYVTPSGWGVPSQAGTPRCPFSAQPPLPPMAVPLPSPEAAAVPRGPVVSSAAKTSAEITLAYRPGHSRGPEFRAREGGIPSHFTCLFADSPNFCFPRIFELLPRALQGSPNSPIDQYLPPKWFTRLN